MANLCISNKYFLSKENIYTINKKTSLFLSKDAYKTKIDKTKMENKEKKIESNYFFPELDKDYLFWCWYIFSKGLSEFYIETEIQTNNIKFTLKKNVKISLIEKLRSDKKKLKQLKIKLNNLEDNLLYGEKLNLETFIALISLEDCNMIFINDKLYYELYNDTNKKTVYICQTDDKYGICTTEPFPDCATLKTNKMVVENINKPLKSISAYKADEIRELCKKFNIDIMKSDKRFKTKRELYLLLQEHLI